MENKKSSETILTIGVVLLALIAVAIFLFLPESNDKVNNSEVEHIVLDRNELTLKIGDTYNLNPIISPSTAIDKTVTYTSNNPSVVTVDNNGLLTAIGVGDAEIRAYTPNGKEDRCIIKVIKENIPIKKITLNRSDIVLNVGESTTLKLTVSPSNATEHKFTWSSSDSSVVTVKNGKVTAIKEGAATITVISESKKVAICNIEVEKKQAESKIVTKPVVTKKATIRLDASEKSLKVGESATLKATIDPVDSNEMISWTTTNANIASVNSSGKITAVAPGTVTITAQLSGGASATCKVTVKKVETGSSNGLEIHFIASGYYDDAILIRTDKATIFMDGGRGKDAVIKYLDEIKIGTIDYVIGSHTEYDHIDAQGEVIKKYNVKNALYPNSITSCRCACESEDVRSVNAALRSKNMTPQVQSVPSKLQIGDMTLYFIAPFTIGCNKNNNSFIFILVYGSTKFMFTGDADSAFNDMNQLISNAKSLGLSGIDADVFKYPHHGNHIIGNKMYDAIGAKKVIVPNYKAPWLPTNQVLNTMKDKGITVYRQSDSETGNILVKSDGRNITIKMGIKAKDYAR